MPFSPPNTFVDGTLLEGADVAENQSALRDYINAGAVQGDLETAVFTTDDIEPPRTLPIYNEVLFATGAFLRRTQMSDVSSQRAYFDGRVKNSDITQQEVLQALPSCGRTFFMPTSGDLLIEFSGKAVGFDPGDYAYFNLTSPSPLIVNSNFFVVIDGVKQADSVCYVFPRQGTGSPPSTQSVAAGTTAFAAGINADRPLYLYFSVANLPAGNHTVQIACDTRFESLYVSAQSFQIEVLLDGGPSIFIGTDYLTGT